MNYEQFIEWTKLRETLTPDDSNFYAYKEAWEVGNALIEPLLDYIPPRIRTLVLYNAVLHYIIVTPFKIKITDEYGAEETTLNPLYQSYSIFDKSTLTSSVSDGSSSASILQTDSMSKLDYLGLDLTRTPYGQFVYSILEQLNLGAVLL